MAEKLRLLNVIKKVFMAILIISITLAIGHNILKNVVHENIEKRFRKTGKIELADWFSCPVFCFKLKIKRKKDIFAKILKEMKEDETE